MSKKVNFITIIVCTYNRAEILNECLTALFNQTASPELYEVLVIDNISTDQTKQVVEGFQKTHTNLRYYLEQKQGLSHARNAGYKNTDAEWVGYMDDDGKPHRNYIEQSLNVINKYNFDCFGGRYFAWFKTPKPKWLNETFGTSPKHLRETGPLNNAYNSGGIIFFKREKLNFIGGFPYNLGMNGGKIAYGEEILIQNKLRDKGWKIGYSPDVKMDHLVAEYKYRFSWHVKAAYAHGRDSVLIWENKDLKIKFHYFLFKIGKLAIMNFGLIFKIRKKDYYLQNFIIDYLSPIIKWIGIYQSYQNKSEAK